MVACMTAVRFLTEEDTAEIRLGVGDRAMFTAAWESFNTPVDIPNLSSSALVPPPPPP
jgi:hypothetical protein